MDRCMARDRPPPYDEGGRAAAKNAPGTVARGPVPRERWSARTMARETRSDARMASEGPRATKKTPPPHPTNDDVSTDTHAP